MICGIMPLLWASDGCDQHLSPEEFRAKQKAFITEKAGLTSDTTCFLGRQYAACSEYGTR